MGQRLETTIFGRPIGSENTTSKPPIMYWENPFHAIFEKGDRDIGVQEKIPKGYLSIADLPRLTPYLFDDGQVLQRTLNGLGYPQAHDGQRLQTRAVPLQIGEKAYILFMETPLGNDPDSPKAHYVIYLSRGPEHCDMGQQARADYRDLIDLHVLADKKIQDPKIRNKFRFVKPIAQGESTLYQGHRYPYFTMPFLDGYGELRFNVRIAQSVTITGLAEGAKSVPIPIPFISYAGPRTDDIRKKVVGNLSLVNQTQETIEQVLQAFNGRVSMQQYETLAYEIDNLLQFRLVRSQLQDILLGNALVYQLTKRNFPREFAINTGDWMGKIYSDGTLDMCLTTVRGGWRHFNSDEQWIQFMKENTDYRGDDNGHMKPFQFFADEEIMEILAQARSYIS